MPVSKQAKKTKTRVPRLGKSDFRKHSATGVDVSPEQNLTPEYLPDGVAMYRADRLATKEQINRSMSALGQVMHEPPKNPFDALKVYRENVPILINWAFANQQLYRDVMRINDQLTGKAGLRNRKRWTEEEDDLLVERAASESSSLMQLATEMGRSPQAITSRLTYLVGINRVRQEIAGRITGYIDGQPVDGSFHGTLTRMREPDDQDLLSDSGQPTEDEPVVRD